MEWNPKENNVYEEKELPHKKPLSHKKYVEYLPSHIAQFFQHHPPTTIYYHAPPIELSAFFSYAYNQRKKTNEYVDIKEHISQNTVSQSPYGNKTNYPIHYYSAKIVTEESITFAVSILKHEKFPNSVVLMGIANKYKIISLKNDVEKLINLAFEFWADQM